jgi:hypothetical protein
MGGPRNGSDTVSANQYDLFWVNKGNMPSFKLMIAEEYGKRRGVLDTKCIGRKKTRSDGNSRDEHWRSYRKWCVDNKIFHDSVIQSDGTEIKLEVAALQTCIKNLRDTWRRVNEKPSGSEGLAEGCFDAQLLEVNTRMTCLGSEMAGF